MDKVPEGENEQEWLVRVGESSRQMQSLLAWKVLYDNVLRLRESFVQKLVAGEEGAELNRRAIVVMDLILKMPAKMVEDGKRRSEDG